MVKKGQAAMEFLMTYGWAIIVVLAAVAALAYFGVLSPSRILPERTTFLAPLPNIDSASIEASTIEVAFRNNVGADITFPAGQGMVGGSAVTMCEGNTVVTMTVPTTTVANGDSFLIEWSCGAVLIDESNDRISADLNFNYTNSATTQIKQHNGQVSGTKA